MNIIIDFREKDILTHCNSQLNGRDLIISTENLLLGDIKINKSLFERKSINDLAASIVDGRYKEQSFRLEKALEEGYKVFYFIEGNMDLYTGAISKNTLVSTIYSLTHKNFQVLLTKNSKETAYFILQFAEKMKKIDIEIKKSYENTEGIVQTKKNKNINRDNISIFMLCQIPGISTTTANILMEKYGHISKLIIEINKNPNEMEQFEYVKQTGNETPNTKSKKLNKNIIKNLNDYLGLC
uniref:ERCC4 domain-containing protein n=1 Tax=viral metagenome TaxID=1070528 RepID=A0A6C0ETA7_9ZZZZ